VLVLDEADRILDSGFKRELNAIISQLPKRRQTMLFSATQTKSVQDLARLSLKDPEYLSVHEESVTATPTLLKQIVTTVPLDQKLDMLWSFIKTHLQSKTLVFLSSCKQVIPLFLSFSKNIFLLDWNHMFMKIGQIILQSKPQKCKIKKSTKQALGLHLSNFCSGF
jgi:ATP-dependent RNA helicase DDX10/DBP4